jgi:hypothetical protein
VQYRGRPLILANPRDVSIAAVSLYDKALNAVLGKSLRLDRPRTYKALNALFEHRNRLAHRGDMTGGMTRDLIKADLEAATECFTYLNQL